MSKRNEMAHRSNSWGVRLLSLSRKVPDCWIFVGSAIFVLVSLGISILCHEANWFSASGGVCVAIGLAIFSELVIPVEEPDVQDAINKAISPGENSGPSESPIQHIARVVENYSNNRWRYLAALQVLIIGTFIWAYGFLIAYVPWLKNGL